MWLSVYSTLIDAMPLPLSAYPRLFKTTLKELAAAAEPAAALRARLLRNGDVTRTFLHRLSISLPPYFVAASLLNKLRGAPLPLVSHLSFLVPSEAVHRFAPLLFASSTSEDHALALALHPSLSSGIGWQHIALRTGLAAPVQGSQAWTSGTHRALQVIGEKRDTDTDTNAHSDAGTLTQAQTQT